jgi:iron complex transport system ATP-binding protein
MFELQNVCLYRKSRVILQDINWKVKDNENWILFGRNGSGKTMLLEIISGYIYPSRGEVIRFGKRHGEYDVREIRKRIGYISTPLKTMFGVREKIIDVVTSGLYASIGLYLEPSAMQVNTAMELLSTIKMESRSNEWFGILSDGEKQKVLMLRALISKPDLLILDEPAMGLDLPSREDLLHTIEKLHNIRNAAIIYVTHHTEEITPMFNKIKIIADGRSFYAGDIKGGLKKETLQKVFDHDVNVVELYKRYYTVLCDK